MALLLLVLSDCDGSCTVMMGIGGCGFGVVSSLLDEDSGDGTCGNGCGTDCGDGGFGDSDGDGDGEGDGECDGDGDDAAADWTSFTIIAVSTVLCLL